MIGFYAAGAMGSGSGPTPPDPIATSILAKLTSWWEMGEASGTRADSVGSNDLGVTSGSISTATGVRGVGDVAANFTGSNALFAPDADSLDPPSGGGDHCLFGWAYFDANSGSQFIAAKWDANTASSLQYALSQQGGVVYAQNGGSGYQTADDSPPTAETWNMYFLWRDAADGKVRLQINTRTPTESAGASNPNPTNHSLAFGQCGSYSGLRLAGRLQRWGWIKGGILTADERAWMYNSGAGRTYAEIVAAAS